LKTESYYSGKFDDWKSQFPALPLKCNIVKSLYHNTMKWNFEKKLNILPVIGQNIFTKFMKTGIVISLEFLITKSYS